MTAGDNQVALPFRQPEIDRQLVNQPFIQALIPTATTGSNTIDWIENDVKTDSSASRAEDDVIPEGSLEYVERSVKLKNYAEYIKVSNEALSDYSFLSSEISSELMNDLNLLLSNQILSGTGLTTNMQGLLTIAKAFDAGNFENLVADANFLDVLRVAGNQIMSAGKGRFTPNFAIVNPEDLTKMHLTKDTTGQYVLPGWQADNGLRLAGIRIIANTAMTADTYLVGDFNRCKLFLKNGIDVQIGLEGSDFKYNRVSIRATLRAALMVKTFDQFAFVTGTFSGDRASLLEGA